MIKFPLPVAFIVCKPIGTQVLSVQPVVFTIFFVGYPKSFRLWKNRSLFGRSCAWHEWLLFIVIQSICCFSTYRRTETQISYVYWTVHHLDSWVKRDQLDATCFIITLFSAQHVSDVNTSIIRSLRLIRKVTSWVVSGSMCVGVPLQCGYGGVVSVCSLKQMY